MSLYIYPLKYLKYGHLNVKIINYVYINYYWELKQIIKILENSIEDQKV